MVDFARLLGVTDLSAPIPDDGIRGFEPNSVVAMIKGQWQLLGLAESMTIENSAEEVNIASLFGRSFASIQTREETTARLVIVDATKTLLSSQMGHDFFEIGLIQKDFGLKGKAFIADSQIEIAEIMRVEMEIRFAGKPTVMVGPTLEQRALKFATEAHADQVRRYDGRPYIYHPIAVSEIVRTFGGSQEMIAAALLHDTVEDTPATLDDIRREFGDKVHDLVEWLTDVSKATDGNRAVRKQIDLEHIAKAPADAQTIKLADIIDNARSIRQDDPNFWKVYRAECGRLLEVMNLGDRRLWAIAADQLLGIDA